VMSAKARAAAPHRDRFELRPGAGSHGRERARSSTPWHKIADPEGYGRSARDKLASVMEHYRKLDPAATERLPTVFRSQRLAHRVF
jgi:hypothetical protein